MISRDVKRPEQLYANAFKDFVPDIENDLNEALSEHMAEKYGKKEKDSEVEEEDLPDPEAFEVLTKELNIPLPESEIRKKMVGKLIKTRNTLLAEISLKDIRSAIKDWIKNNQEKKTNDLLENFGQIVGEQTRNELHEAFVNLGLVSKVASEEEIEQQYTTALGKFIPQDRKGPIEIISKNMAKKYGKP
jgi:hypothetical protein